MASSEDLRQPLINSFTSSSSSNVKYTEPTTLAMTSTPISPKIKNKEGFRSRLKHRVRYVARIFMSTISHRLALRTQLHRRV